ncbi:MAG: cadherin domain-containing protein, partial [Beijerinckiaceae bacterium]|nr:cadherin domain-containing protein [Beijerinckiaceae bacterium]
QNIAVTVTNQNEAPTITSSATASAVENGTAVMTVTATDPDAGATLGYTIVGGADSAKFTINPTTGVLTFVTAPNFEAPTDAGNNNVYDVQVQVADGLGGTVTQNIAVTVTNQNEAPTITSATTVSVAENGTAVMTVTATDPDAGATLTYSIFGGADAGKFTINPTTGVLSFVTAPNFESPTDVGGNNVYDVQVAVEDQFGAASVQNLAVTVTNINENPTITSSGTVAIQENSTAALTVTATDPDASPTFGYSISGGADASLFTINSTTGEVTFNSAPDYENPADAGGNNVYNIDILVTDGQGGSATQAVSITVNNQTNTVNGTAGNDTLNGTGEDDIMNGLAGNDTLNGSARADVMNGGADSDTVVYDLSGSGVTVNLATNSATGGDAEGDTFIDIENIFGSSNDDSLTGTSGVNLIRGGNGNDTIRGNGGIDQLFGNAGNDTFILDLDVQSTSLTIDGGADQDAVNLVGTGSFTLGQLSFLTSIETIDFEAAGVSANLTNFTANDAVNVLGASGPGNTLTFKMDGNDTFTVAAGEHFTQTGSDYTFFTDGTLTTELAKVSIV